MTDTNNKPEKKAPVLSNNRETVTIELPSFEGSQVEVYTSLLVGDMRDMSELDNDVTKATKILPNIVKAWNFVDEEGKPVQPNAAAFMKLPPEDVTFIIETLEKTTHEAKKD